MKHLDIFPDINMKPKPITYNSFIEKDIVKVNKTSSNHSTNIPSTKPDLSLKPEDTNTKG